MKKWLQPLFIKDINLYIPVFIQPVHYLSTMFHENSCNFFSNPAARQQLYSHQHTIQLYLYDDFILYILYCFTIYTYWPLY